MASSGENETIGMEGNEDIESLKESVDVLDDNYEGDMRKGDVDEDVEEVLESDELDNGVNEDDIPYERAIAAVAAAAAAHSAQQHKSPSEEAELAKQTISKSGSLLGSPQKMEVKECVVNEATYALIRSRVEGIKLSTYNESLLLLTLVLANPGYALSLASLHHTNTANPQQPTAQSDPSETISKELIDAASVLHKHIQHTYNILSHRIPHPENDNLILDLLPPCYSADDATNAFFTACSRKINPPQTKEKTPPPPTYAPTTIASVLSSKLGRIRPQKEETNDKPQEEDNDDTIVEGQDYSIQISREMLGLTVENVLERTIVRTVLPNGAAKKAGAKVGSLIVQVGTVQTKYLTHFETIDELRQSQRPLKLILRRISRKALAGAREEMGRLIRGGGYGFIWGLIEDRKEDDFVVMIRYLKHLWRNKQLSTDDTKKDQALVKAGEKLIWILILLCHGLEQQTKPNKESPNPKDAAKSVSKILADYIIRLIQSTTKNHETTAEETIPKKYIHPRKKVEKRVKQAQNQESSPLFQIGDVLHRTQTFLADPYSPPAALLRGELIALLCDVLDIDTDMELAEIETATTSSFKRKKSSQGGPITDLGSSGSLLKLIVRNCTVMQSQTCYLQKEDHWKHAGNRFLAVVHRLAASRSTSARVTACSLAPVLWSHLDFPHQLQLRGVITRALHDVEVIVRKSTAAVLHEIAELVFDSRAVPWLVLMCERAMTDPDPQLRAAAMTLTWHLAEHLPNAFLGDASKGSRSLSRLPSRSDPTFAEVYLLQCKLLPVATRLGEDRAPSVRLAVAAQCDRLCTALGEHWFIVIIDLLQALLADSDDRVRSEAILCMPRLVESVLLGSNFQDTEEGKIGVLEALLPVAIKLLKDSSTLVRVSLATSCGELLTFLVALGRGTSESENDVDYKRHKKHVDETLIPLVQRLLHDSDPEVTSAALRAVTNASRGNVRKISSRRPYMHHHSEDDSSPYLSDEDSVEIAEPVFLPVLSEKQVLRLLPTLSDLATSPQWRVRQSAVEIVPALLGCTELLETRTKIAKLCITLMDDQVDAVRKTAAECLCLGGSSLASGPSSETSCVKTEWISTIVLPHLTETCNSPNCKQRILCLKMVEVILCNHSTTSSTVLRQLLDISLSLSEDPIANVRLNVGRVLAHVMHALDRENVLYTRERLEEMLIQEKDRHCDRDVLYFVQKAITKSNSHL